MTSPKSCNSRGERVLPNELITEVFLRSDACLVARCRCLSREWKDILQGEAFLLEHSQRCFAMQPSCLLHAWLPQRIACTETILRICPSTGNQLYFPSLAFLKNCVDITIVGIQHGSIYFMYSRADGTFELLVWNIFTKAKRFIPGPPNDGFLVLLPTISYAHVPGTVQYSIVFTFRKSMHDQFLMYQIYSSDDHKWSTTRGIIGNIFRLSLHSVILNGIIYWINYSNEVDDSADSIISFCTATRTFDKLNLPPNYHSTCDSLILYEDRIALLYLLATSNNFVASILSLRKNNHAKLSWRVDLKLKCLRVHDIPRCFIGGDLISVTEDDQDGLPGKEAIVVSKFKQSLQYARVHIACLAWNQEIELKYVNEFSFGLFPV
ncbi:hypothetical protein PIB30_026130 [Stylosanthes scabra]|uniref:F-box domain-containing protein n=1 Tax=Stylosanthes scabra TaxID=79078 RepID=A0ABU6U9I4_9FABA|nr:hypothetical protein [Stylosanthes scabra]